MRPLSRRGFLVAIAAIIVVAAVTATVTSLRDRTSGEERASWAAPFEPHLGEYLPGSIDAEPAGEQAYVRGKLVFVNENTGQLDALNYFEEFTDLTAAIPEEVSTVIWTRYGRSWDHSEHSIIGTKEYYINHIDITVLDLQQKKVWGTVSFHSRLPVEAEPIDDATLTDQVVDFVRSLPQR